MADVIRLVKGNSKPDIILTLTDDGTGGAIDLSAPTTTVTVKFRKQNTTTVLSTINANKVSGGATGQVQFDFAGGVLNVDAGMYEGEVNIDFNGSLQTVYDLIKFRVRDNF
jgi:5,10-methenyltetrahydromethanopterin hydrogenase|tara:strand:- start:1555 stop:1887 length:333 start_codon:yes stop_codon:yes gene_type:complete